VSRVLSQIRILDCKQCIFESLTPPFHRTQKWFRLLESVHARTLADTVPIEVTEHELNLEMHPGEIIDR